MIRIIRLYRELANYRAYKKVIKKESFDSPKWSKFRLRKDWINRIYTVVNLPKSITESPDFPREGRPAYVMDEVSPINDYLGMELNLSEVITIGMEPVKEVNGDSYLVYWFFLFRELTIMYVLRLISMISLLTWGIIKWENIYNFVAIHLTVIYDKIITLF